MTGERDSELDWQTVASHELDSSGWAPGLYGHIEDGSSLAELSTGDRLTGHIFETHQSILGTFSGPQSSVGVAKYRERLVRLGSKARQAKDSVRRASGLPSPRGTSSTQDSPKVFRRRWRWKSLESLPSDVTSPDYPTAGFERAQPGVAGTCRHYHSDTEYRNSLDSPRLPFPLISLPQAAFLQHNRIESGEEDHTGYGSSLANRTVSTAISNLSSPTSPYIFHRTYLCSTWCDTSSNLTANQAVEHLHNGTGRPNGK